MDQFEDFGFDLVEGEVGGVEFDGVFGGDEGGGGAGGVLVVALADGLEDLVIVSGLTGLFELELSAFGAFLDGGVEEDFELCVREDDGSLVASFGDDVVELGGELSLLVDHGVSDLRQGGDAAGEG